MHYPPPRRAMTHGGATVRSTHPRLLQTDAAYELDADFRTVSAEQIFIVQAVDKATPHPLVLMSPHRDYGALVRRWFEEVWNQRKPETIDELMDVSCLTDVEGLDSPIDRTAFREYHAAFLKAVPDVSCRAEIVSSDGPVVVAFWQAWGTHLGDGFGIPPTGRRAEFRGLSVFRFRDGRIVRGMDKWNRGEMIARLMQVSPVDVSGRTRLTRREAEVALLMAERWHTSEIAQKLGIRLNTARRHCESVLRKLQVGRRDDVAAALGRVPGSPLSRHGIEER